MMRAIFAGALLVLSFFVLGCGDDSSSTSTSRGVRGAGGAGGTRVSRSNQAAKSEAAAATCRTLPPNLISASWTEQKTLVAEVKASTLRDPFEVAAENMVEEVSESENENDPRLDSVVSGYEVSELKFTMAVTGQPPAFALLKDPSGFGHDVYVGDIVGTKPKMRVEAITSNEIVFQAVERIDGSDGAREHRKSLLTQEELQELQP